jgi:MFS family permease
MEPHGAVRSVLHPPRYVVASLLAGLGGFLFGLDTGTIGPVTAMSQFEDSFGGLSATVHGLIVSSILITGALSSFMAGHLADAVGRPRGMAIGAAVFGVGAALEAGAVHLAMLFLGRLVTGAGEGLFLSTTVVYICEIVPAEGRGVIASAPQFFVTFALVVGYFFCYGSVRLESSLAWRLPFALQAGAAFAWGAALVVFLPQSPRWLKAVGRGEEVDEAWERLGVVPGVDGGDAEAREVETEAGLNREPLALRRTTTRGTVREEVHVLLRVFAPEAWRPTALGVFMMSMMQLSGIDGVLYVCRLNP